MLQFLKRFFNKPAPDATVPADAPYKVESPTPVTESKSDGGIWPFPTVAPVVETVPAKREPAKRGPAKKTPAAKKAPAQPRVKKTPNK